MLHWFHATSRSGAKDYIEVLRSGLKPSPKVTKTQQIEMHLGIDSPHVYCYLGRTLEIFGEFCVVLTAETLPEGKMSPFDSGGLQKNTPPVSGWTREKQVEYLNGWTFHTSSRPMLLERYPATRVVDYLACNRPSEPGPHTVLTGGPVADIWRDSKNDWRAWTWEGRWPNLPADGHMRAWACSPPLFTHIVDALESEPTDFATRLVDCFCEGGVGALVRQMQEEQLHG